MPGSTLMMQYTHAACLTVMLRYMIETCQTAVASTDCKGFLRMVKTRPALLHHELWARVNINFMCVLSTATVFIVTDECYIVCLGLQGGLWRLTGQQIAGAAAEGEGGASSSKAGGAGGGEGAGGEDVRGPHASLAVKLQVCTTLNHQPSCLCMSL